MLNFKFWLFSIFQLITKCILQSANLQCSNISPSSPPTFATDPIHERVSRPFVGRRQLSLSVLLAHIPVRAAVCFHHRAGLSLCRAALGQLLAESSWCEYHWNVKILLKISCSSMNQCRWYVTVIRYRFVCCMSWKKSLCGTMSN